MRKKMFFFSERMVKERRLYDILEVDPCADAATLKKKYRELARKYHPDRNKEGAELFKELSLAYATLTDPEKRNIYNLKGEKGLKKPCCKAPAYPDKTVKKSKKVSLSGFENREEPEMTVSSGDENDEVEVVDLTSETPSNTVKRKLGNGYDASEEKKIKQTRWSGYAPSGHEYAAKKHPVHGHAGHDHSGHSHGGHDHSGHSHAGHGHSGHDHAGHDHSGHDHHGHAHGSHDHSGHNHDHSDEEDESEDEGEGESCPCCPAIGMSPAMMQKLMAMQMQYGIDLSDLLK